MWVVLVLLFAAVFSLAPVTLQVDLGHDRQTFFRIRFQVYGFTIERRFQLVRTAAGHQLIVIGKGKPHTLISGRLHQELAMRAVELISRTAQARKSFLRRITFVRLSVYLRIHAADAAKTALYTAAAGSAAKLLPPSWRKKLQFRIVPDFSRWQTIAQARCILHFRLGTILITGIMLLSSSILQHVSKAREETDHGASYR